MAILQQQATSDTWYYGWYGINKDTCTQFTLVESADGSNSTFSWRHAIFPTDPSANTMMSVGTSTFFRIVKEVNSEAGGTTIYDGTQASVFGLAGSQVKELVCGRCYNIVLQPGNDILDIPEFQFADQSTTEYYKLVSNEG